VKNKLYYERITNFKEEFKMMVWELALLLVAITYMVINTVSIVVAVKLMARYDGVLTRVLGLAEKVLDKTEKELEEDGTI
jgi:hypothetical protein